MKPAALTLRASHFMPRSLLRLRHPHRIRYSLTPPLGPQRNKCRSHCEVCTPDSQFDARTFERIAWLWARDGRLFDDFTTGSYLYSWLSSGIYLLFGRVPFLLHVINSYFGTLTIYFVMRSARLLSANTHIDRAAGWTLAFYPSAVLYSVLTMREAPMVLALSISIHLLLSWVTTRRIAFGLGAVSFMMVAQLFHAGMIGATLAVVLIYSRVSLQSVTVRDNLRPLALFMVMATAIGLLQFSLRTGIGLEKLWALLRDFDINTITSWHAYSARGRGAYLSGVEMDVWFGLGLEPTPSGTLFSRQSIHLDGVSISRYPRVA